jgi:hypothetical protein
MIEATHGADRVNRELLPVNERNLKSYACACTCVGINVMPHVLASFLNVDRSQPIASDRLKPRIRSKAASCDDPLRYVPCLPYPIAI